MASVNDFRERKRGRGYGNSSDVAISVGWAPWTYNLTDIRRRIENFCLLSVMMLIMIGICALKIYNIRWFWYNPWLHAYSLLVSSYILSRAILAVFYREPEDRGYLPKVSVVIAVKNEEGHIAETIHHCFESRYPDSRLEVLVVDDSSTDNTWKVASELPQRYQNLQLFQLPEGQQGKRHAMALGAEKALGEIIVYVDSDCIVEPDGIYKIVQAFTDPKVGAVAGHVKVIVEKNSLISKMESVRYFISHRFMKAAESIFGVVCCCSGAFSAYRRDAVLRVLPAWLNQKFLGARATFGDDRSLTNFIMRNYRILFHNGARCKTYVPDNWPKYFRQQLRWKKSWSRETLIASQILFKKHPAAAVSYYTGVLLTLIAPLMVMRNMVYLPLVHSGGCLTYILGLALVYLFFCISYFYFTRSRYWYYGLFFAVVYIGVLSWQNYYAIATVRRSHWGTR